MIPISDTQPSYSKPFVTIGIIAVNVLVFFYQISLDAYSLNHFITEYAVIPARLDYLDLVTSTFLHGGWMHIIGNMWFLWIYGDNVEDVLGHGQFLMFYLLCGIAAALLQIAVMPSSRIPNVGASGAIAGVMGAYLLKFPHAKVRTLVILFVFITMTEIPAWIILIYWFVIQIFSGIGSIGEFSAARGGVAWFAHIGGFIAGMILIKVLKTRAMYSHRPDLNW